MNRRLFLTTIVPAIFVPKLIKPVWKRIVVEDPMVDPVYRAFIYEGIITDDAGATIASYASMNPMMGAFLRKMLTRV